VPQEVESGHCGMDLVHKARPERCGSPHDGGAPGMPA
jgi:hypothetical protein